MKSGDIDLFSPLAGWGYEVNCYKRFETLYTYAWAKHYVRLGYSNFVLPGQAINNFCLILFFNDTVF